MLADYLTAWMSDLLTCWPADWLILYLLANWQTISLPEWVTCWPADWLTLYLLANWLTCWPADYLTQWLSKWLNFWLTTDLLTCRYMYTTSLIDWLFNFLPNCLTDYNNWLTQGDWLTHWLTKCDSQQDFFTSAEIPSAHQCFNVHAPLTLILQIY